MNIEYTQYINKLNLIKHVNKPIETNERKSFIRSFVCYLSKAQNQKTNQNHFLKLHEYFKICKP